MTISQIIDKSQIGDEVFVIRPMLIRWNSMRFEYTNIVSALYVVVESNEAGLWGNNRSNMLKAKDLPEGTKNYPSYLHSSNNEFQAFKSSEEAEIWKVIELQGLEAAVAEHISQLQDKTQKKIKKLKQKEKLDEYLEKYPDKFLKVM